METNGDLYAFKQVSTNLYLAGSAAEGDRPKLLENREPFKVDVKNGKVALLSRAGARLCCEGQTLTWRTNPGNNKDYWEVQAANQSSNQGFNNNQNQNNLYPGFENDMSKGFGFSISTNQGSNQGLNSGNQGGQGFGGSGFQGGINDIFVAKHSESLFSNPGSNQGFNQGFNQGNQGFNQGNQPSLPNGAQVYISNNGNYIGGIKHANADLQLVKHEKEWEQFTV